MVDIALSVLFMPDITKLPNIHQELGENYDERVLPSIINESLKGVVAQYNANQLMTKRPEVSLMIRRNLAERAAEFNIIIHEMSITHVHFGKAFRKAVEDKQIAQQEAEKAKYIVKQALQDKRSAIIKAQGEAESAKLIGQALQQNPSFIELRQMDTAKQIATHISGSNNKVYLDSEALLLNIMRTDGQSRLADKN
jgi:prohibitin 2